MKKIILASFFMLNIYVCTEAAPNVSKAKNIIINGVVRKYRIYIPTVYDGTKSVPLLFNFHGKTSSAKEQESYGDFRKIADTANFILIHPQGLPNSLGENSWNVNNAIINESDVDFISALIDNLLANYNINPNRIYLAGLSFGGTMSFKLACVLHSKITAIACVAGAMNFSQKTDCGFSHIMPVMQIHGTADNVIPYYGNNNFLSIEQIVNFWGKPDNCDTLNPEFQQIPNLVSTDGSTAENNIFKNNTDGFIEHYKVIGGGHSWPGAKFYIDVTNQDFSASKVIWNFLRKFETNTLPTVNLAISEINDSETEQTQTNKKNNTTENNVPTINSTPNPFTNEILILLENFETSSTITIHNILGQLMETDYSNKSANNVTINTSNWTKGIYIITANEEGKITHSRILKN